MHFSGLVQKLRCLYLAWLSLEKESDDAFTIKFLFHHDRITNHEHTDCWPWFNLTWPAQRHAMLWQFPLIFWRLCDAALEMKKRGFPCWQWQVAFCIAFDCAHRIPTPTTILVLLSSRGNRLGIIPGIETEHWVNMLQMVNKKNIAEHCWTCAIFRATAFVILLTLAWKWTDPPLPYQSCPLLVTHYSNLKTSEFTELKCDQFELHSTR